MISRARLGLLAGVMAVAVFVGLVVMPTTTWLSQRSAIDETRLQLAAVRAESDTLDERLDELSDPVSIEQRARAEYGLVDAYEETYLVTPPVVEAVALPDYWPFSQLQDSLSGSSE